MVHIFDLIIEVMRFWWPLKGNPLFQFVSTFVTILSYFGQDLSSILGQFGYDLIIILSEFESILAQFWLEFGWDFIDFESIYYQFSVIFYEFWVRGNTGFWLIFYEFYRENSWFLVDFEWELVLIFSEFLPEISFNFHWFWFILLNFIIKNWGPNPNPLFLFLSHFSSIFQDLVDIFGQ